MTDNNNSVNCTKFFPPMVYFRISKESLVLAMAAGVVAALAGCADSNYRPVSAHLNNYHCPIDRMTTDTNRTELRWMGGKGGMCAVENMKTGKISIRLFTFLSMDKDADAAGLIFNPADVENAIGSVLIDGQKQVVYSENRIWQGFEQFRPSSSEATFTLIKESSYHQDDGSDVPSKIYKYTDVYQSRRSKGEWEVTFINVEGQPFAVKWQQTKLADAYQQVNDRAAPSYAIVNIAGLTQISKNRPLINSQSE